jgi:ATP-dependent Clp protease ATP-binding subunit ClpC
MMPWFRRWFGGAKPRLFEQVAEPTTGSAGAVTSRARQLERLTERGRKVLALANQEAQRFNHEYIGTQHILLGLLKEGSGVAARVFNDLGVDLDQIRGLVAELVEGGPDMATTGKLPPSLHAKRVIEYAIEEARAQMRTEVDCEHLLLGLLHDADMIAAKLLIHLGLKLEHVRERVLQVVGQRPTD